MSNSDDEGQAGEAVLTLEDPSEDEAGELDAQVDPEPEPTPPARLKRRLVAGLLAGLVAFVVQAGLDTNFYSLRQAAMFWVFFGLALGVHERALTQASSDS